MKSVITVEDLFQGGMPLEDGIKSSTVWGYASRNPYRSKTSLQGRVLGMAFFEPSTRTNLSFKAAALAEGMQVLELPPLEASSLTKGESLLDTVRNMWCLNIDALVIRTPDPGLFQDMEQEGILKGVINAGAGATGEHPTQALGDFLTFRDLAGADPRYKDLFSATSLKNRQKEMPGITILGDIRRSRVARSHINMWTRLGIPVTLGAPTEFLPEDVSNLDVKVAGSLSEALEGSLAVMALRVQKERYVGAPDDLEALVEEYRQNWQIDVGHIKGPGTPYLMHPGPVNYGVEVTREAAYHVKSQILTQVQDGLEARRWLLHRMFNS